MVPPQKATIERKDDLINAGGVWSDAAVVVDRHFVSSRKPDDLPDFCEGILIVLTTRSPSARME